MKDKTRLMFWWTEPSLSSYIISLTLKCIFYLLVVFILLSFLGEKLKLIFRLISVEYLITQLQFMFENIFSLLIKLRPKSMKFSWEYLMIKNGIKEPFHGWNKSSFIMSVVICLELFKQIKLLSCWHQFVRDFCFTH